MFEWGDFIKTPPQNNFLNISSDVELNDSNILMENKSQSFLPKSPSVPSFFSTDPTSTLEYLGLNSSNNEIQPFEYQEFPKFEIETRNLILGNCSPFYLEKNIRNLIHPSIPIKKIEKNSTNSFEIFFYDLRHSQYYRNYLNNKKINSNTFSCRYSNYKNLDNSENSQNNGTIVIFHLNPKISNNQLETTFSTYGEIRQIRSTPSKPYQRFMEYWDLRCAELALKAMNGKILLGTKISIEFSYPGGIRKFKQ